MEEPKDNQPQAEPVDTVQNEPATEPVINDVLPPPADTPKKESTQNIVVVEDTSDDDIQPADESARAGEAQAQDSDTMNPSVPAAVPGENLPPVDQPPEQSEMMQETLMDSSDNAAAERDKHATVETNVDANLAAATATVGMASSQMNKHPHRNNRQFAVIVTLIVAVLLAGVAVYVYLTTDSNTAESTSQENRTVVEESEVEAELVLPATSDTVEASIAEIESSLAELDDDAEFDDAELSDSTLGL